MLALLLQNRLRTMVNSVRYGGKKGRRRLLGYIGLIVLPILVMINMYAVMKVMAASPQLGVHAIQLLLRNLLFGIFIMLVFSGLALVLHIFFLSRDLPLLLSSPIEIITIFKMKMFEATLANSTLFFGLALPVIITAGMVLQTPVLFWLLLLPLSALFLTIPTGISAFLAMGLVSIMPPRRAKNLSAVLLSLISIAVWLVFQLLRPEQFRASNAILPGKHLLETSARIAAWFPSDWLANSLIRVMQHDYAGAAFHGSLLLAAGLFLHFATATLLQRAMRRDVFSSTESSGRKHTLTLPAAWRDASGRTSLFWSIARRDLKIILRDTHMLTQLLLFTLMMVLLPFLNRSGSTESGALRPYMPFLFLFVFSSMIGSSFAARMVPMERSAFGLLKLAPVRLGRVWLAKMMVSYGLTLTSGLAAAAIVALFHHTPLPALLRAIVLFAIVGGGTTAVGGLFGALFPNFEWDHPKRMLSAGSSLLLSLALLLFLLLVGGLVGLSLWLLHSPDAGILASGFLSLGLLFLGTVTAGKKLERIEWRY